MNMNSCPHSEKILEYVLNLLSKEEREEFRKHLQSCTACQKELQLETAIDRELAVELQPGYIEEHVHAKLKARQTFGVGFSWLYALRMASYAVTAIVVAFVLPPIILRFPFVQRIDVIQYFGTIATSVHRMLPSIQLSFLLTGFGAMFMVASIVYSLAYLRK